MPCRSDDKERQLPSDSDYFIPPTKRRKYGAEQVPISGEGSSQYLLRLIRLKSRVRNGLRSRALRNKARWPILHRIGLRYPFSGEGSNSIPPPVKNVQAPHSILNYEDEVLVTRIRMSGKALQST